MYTVFSTLKNDALREPLFLGNPVNVARYDQQKYPLFEKLIEKQLSFFWRPEEIDVSKDRIDYQALTTHEQHIFISNLKYQTLLDSIQGRSPNVAFLPLVSLPELETWIETWSFSETIHSRSYTHIIRNLVPDPGVIFDDILCNAEILKRAQDIAFYYDVLVKRTYQYFMFQEQNGRGRAQEATALKEALMRSLYRALISVNALEAIRFYVSFACSFAFAERKVMEGNAKIIKLIARDEALHLTGTEYILNLLRHQCDDPELCRVAHALQDEARTIFLTVAEQEKAWAKYLFQSGSMIGLNESILCQYIEYVTRDRMLVIGLECPFPARPNPIPWINGWLNYDNVQVAPQEVEISSYLVGQVDSTIQTNDFDDIQL